jgi:hypothetical protein
VFFSFPKHTKEENRKGGGLSISAFIAEDKTINSIVNWLDSALEEAYGTIIIRQKLLARMTKLPNQRARDNMGKNL